MTGAEIVAHCLKEARVPFVFAYPGAASMALHHALHDAKVRVILPRHEQAERSRPVDMHGRRVKLASAWRQVGQARRIS